MDQEFTHSEDEEEVVDVADEAAPFAEQESPVPPPGPDEPEDEGRRRGGKGTRHHQFRPHPRPHQHHHPPFPLRRRQVRLRDPRRDRPQKPQPVSAQTAFPLQRPEAPGKGGLYHVLLGRHGRRRQTQVLLPHRPGQGGRRAQPHGMGILPHRHRQPHLRQGLRLLLPRPFPRRYARSAPIDEPRSHRRD